MPYRKSHRRLPQHYWSKEVSNEQAPDIAPDNSKDQGRFVVLRSGTINFVKIDDGLIPHEDISETGGDSLVKPNYNPDIEP